MSIQENLAKAAAFLRERGIEEGDGFVSVDATEIKMFVTSLETFKQLLQGTQAKRRDCGLVVEWRGEIDGVIIRHDQYQPGKPESETVQL